jgi:hypothetical protein
VKEYWHKEIQGTYFILLCKNSFLMFFLAFEFIFLGDINTNNQGWVSEITTENSL